MTKKWRVMILKIRVLHVAFRQRKTPDVCATRPTIMFCHLLRYFKFMLIVYQYDRN